MSKQDCIGRLLKAGISYEDAVALRRVAMVLDRWHELECGDANGHAVERDEKTEKPFLTYDIGGNGQRARHPIPDREKGALARLEKIMARYPDLSFYVQGDPRGAPLFILRPGDVPEGGERLAYYSNGIAVYK